MARYDASIDLRNPNLSHTQVVDLVGTDRAVLDVGCASGDLARALAGRGCRVSGVESDPEAADVARPDLDQLVVADLNTSALTEHFKPASFDVIVFADVLEHLLDPARVLADALGLLRPKGRVVVSVPNVAHGAVRLALLQGRWQYTPRGLLDASHLRFFTRKTFLELLQDAGLVVTELRSTVADPLGTEVEIAAEDIPASMIEWVRDQPDGLTYQFVASARVALDTDDLTDVPELVPAVSAEEIRVADAHTRTHQDQVRDQTELRHRLMTVRDHVIGLEVTAATALQRLAKAEGRANRATTRAEDLRQRVAAAKKRARRADARAARAEARARRAVRRANVLRRELSDVKASRSWRVGRAMTSPLRIGRGRKEN